ncbi:hypothetical protein N2152v2_002972 [Parachlorella kessleri]
MAATLQAPAPLRPPAAASSRRARPLAARSSAGAVQVCGLDQEAAAARMALAPPSVQAFIARWGRRDGIDAAYSAACTINWESAILETIDEVPGHHHETNSEAAFRDILEAAAQEDLVEEDFATRLARAPPSVQAFILRWGRREGIDAAA